MIKTICYHGQYVTITQRCYPFDTATMFVVLNSVHLPGYSTPPWKLLSEANREKLLNQFGQRPIAGLGTKSLEFDFVDSEVAAVQK